MSKSNYEKTLQTSSAKRFDNCPEGLTPESLKRKLLGINNWTVLERVECRWRFCLTQAPLGLLPHFLTHKSWKTRSKPNLFCIFTFGADTPCYCCHHIMGSPFSLGQPTKEGMELLKETDKQENRTTEKLKNWKRQKIRCRNSWCKNKPTNTTYKRKTNKQTKCTSDPRRPS